MKGGLRSRGRVVRAGGPQIKVNDLPRRCTKRLEGEKEGGWGGGFGKNGERERIRAIRGEEICILHLPQRAKRGSLMSIEDLERGGPYNSADSEIKGEEWSGGSSSNPKGGGERSERGGSSLLVTTSIGRAENGGGGGEKEWGKEKTEKPLLAQVGKGKEKKWNLRGGVPITEENTGPPVMGNGISMARRDRKTRRGLGGGMASRRKRNTGGGGT